MLKQAIMDKNLCDDTYPNTNIVNVKKLLKIKQNYFLLKPDIAQFSSSISILIKKNKGNSLQNFGYDKNTTPYKN